MEHHTSLKIIRLLACGVLISSWCGVAEATLNILGMPVTVQTVGDVMDFTMGGSKGCDDEDDEEVEYSPPEPPSPKKEDSPPGKCLDVRPSAWTLSNMYRDQPLFMNFRPRTEEAMLIDNICYTFFPLPDDQFTYVMYSSTVFRDGSNLIESDIVTDVQLGIFRAASPYCTFKDHVLGYAGCDTFVMYRCFLSSECRNKNSVYAFGLSQSCKQISISCLQKIEDIIQGNGIPEQDYVALPMKLPTKCVFDPVCTFKGNVEVIDVGLQEDIIAPTVEEYRYEEILDEPFIEREIIHPITDVGPATSLIQPSFLPSYLDHHLQIPMGYNYPVYNPGYPYPGYFQHPQNALFPYMYR